MTYCFRCESCGASVETGQREPAPDCAHGPMVRDYRAEGFGIGTGVKVSRDGLVSDQARVFLPTNEDFKGPGDPDGTMGMRDWREGQAPKAGNSKPFWPGDVERKVF